MKSLLMVVFAVLVAQPASAARLLIETTGQITGIYGSGPSLDVLGLSWGDPVQYQVYVDTQRDGYWIEGDGTIVVAQDESFGDDGYSIAFFAELLAAPYTASGTYSGSNREFFTGRDVVSEAFIDCHVLGRLFVGQDSFHIDGCAPVAEWAPGLAVGSSHIWHDPDTGQAITVATYGSVTAVTQLPAVPVMGPLGSAVLALALMLSASGLRTACRTSDAHSALSE